MLAYCPKDTIRIANLLGEDKNAWHYYLKKEKYPRHFLRATTGIKRRKSTAKKRKEVLVRSIWVSRLALRKVKFKLLKSLYFVHHQRCFVLPSQLPFRDTRSVLEVYCKKRQQNATKALLLEDRSDCLSESQMYHVSQSAYMSIIPNFKQKWKITIRNFCLNFWFWC